MNAAPLFKSKICTLYGNGKEKLGKIIFWICSQNIFMISCGFSVRVEFVKFKRQRKIFCDLYRLCPQKFLIMYNAAIIPSELCHFLKNTHCFLSPVTVLFTCKQNLKSSRWLFNALMIGFYLPCFISILEQISVNKVRCSRKYKRLRGRKYLR